MLKQTFLLQKALFRGKYTLFIYKKAANETACGFFMMECRHYTRASNSFPIL